MELKDRLKVARKKAGLTQSQVVQDIQGLSQPAYSELERGLSKSTTKIIELANLFEVNPIWLSSGKGEMTLVSENDNSIPQFIHGANLDHIVIGQHTHYPLVEIEYKDMVACCGHGYANSEYPEAFTQSFTVEFLRANNLPIDGKGLILMHACGDSMGYTIPSGTVILVNTNEAFFDSLVSNKIYVFTANGEMICKRAIKNIDGTVTLKSDNSNKDLFPDYKIDKDNFENYSMFGRVRYVFMQM